MKGLAYSVVLFTAISVSLIPADGGRTRHEPTHTSTDSISALKELIFGRFRLSGLTTFVKGLEGPILYKTYQPKPGSDVGSDPSQGWQPNPNENYDLLGIGGRPVTNKKGGLKVKAPAPGGLEGVKEKVKSYFLQKLERKKEKKKFQIQATNHLIDSIKAKKAKKKRVPGSGGLPGIQPGSQEYELLKQYHLMGVVDMYRPPAEEETDILPGGFGAGGGWGEEGGQAAAPTPNKAKKMKKKKQKKQKKKVKKKQKKVKKNIKKKQAQAKKKMKQKVKEAAAAAAAAPGQGWGSAGGGGQAPVRPAPNASPYIGIPAIPAIPGISAIPAIPAIPVGSGRYSPNKNQTPASTYKRKKIKKFSRPSRPAKIGAEGAKKQRINNRLYKKRVGEGSLPSLAKKSSSPAMDSHTISDRLGLAAPASVSDTYSSEEGPYYDTYRAVYRVPNYANIWHG